jgi:hypothetical protein
VADLEGTAVCQQQLLDCKEGRQLQNGEALREILIGEEKYNDADANRREILLVRVAPVIHRPVASKKVSIQEDCGTTLVGWLSDAGALRKRERQIVSSRFSVQAGESKRLDLKIVMHPEGHGSFRDSNGRGSIQLKCDTWFESFSSCNFQYRVWLGEGQLMQEPRGPFSHDFSKNSICRLPKDCEIFDFASVLEHAANSETFAVFIEILSCEWLV